MSSSTDLSAARRFAPLRVGAGPSAVDEREIARATGYADGWAHGRHDAVAAQAEQLVRDEEEHRRLEQALTAQTQVACDALDRAVRQLESRTVPTLDEMADVVLDGVVRLAEAVLGAELSVLDDAGRLALRRALAPLPDDGRVAVRMNPRDLEVVRAAQVNDVTAAGTQRIEGHEVELVPDASLGRGEAVADLGAARVDARLAAALHRAVVAAGLLGDDPVGAR
jgi:flagellar assembly protein FliH